MEYLASLRLGVQFSKIFGKYKLVFSPFLLAKPFVDCFVY